MAEWLSFHAGRAMRAIWRGPFYIGTLSRPVPIGEAVFKLLEITWRLAVVLACALVIGSLYFWAEPQLNPPLEKRIITRIVYDDGSIEVPPVVRDDSTKPFRCNPDYPIKVYFDNPTGKTITEISYGVRAFRPGHSNAISDGFSDAKLDLIMKPRTTAVQCSAVSLPHWAEPKTLEYKVDIWSVTADS